MQSETGFSDEINDPVEDGFREPAFVYRKISQHVPHPEDDPMSSLSEENQPATKPSVTGITTGLPTGKTSANNPKVKDLSSPFNIGNHSSFTLVYNQLYSYAFFYARRFVSLEDATDIVASVFLRIWVMPDQQFANATHIKGFLRVCIRNACLTHLRGEKNRIRKEETWVERYENELETEAEAAANEINAEKMQRIHTCIEKLPLKCREVFKMAFLENLKNKQIAEKLGVSEKTVKNHKVHALRKLRMALLTLLIVFMLMVNH